VKARDFYAAFADSPSRIRFNFTLAAGHAWPQDRSSTFAVPCGAWGIKAIEAWPLEHCDYDGPGEMLQHFYGTQEKPLKPPADVMTAESLHYFDQTPFDGNASNARGLVGLGPSGLVYVPKACAANRTSCALHLFLHGCSNPFLMTHLEARALSVNRWAEANNIVVVFPHKESGEAGSCWDGYGDSGPDYDTRSGPQMLAIKNMIEAISGIVM
jgi:poly(3-hydroxybutyrate) depolymerase